jgi:two-component system CheB/CheR fusion protein
MKKKAKASSSVLETSKMNEQIVIGIGASAGGLEALQDFFSAMPVDTSLAFVVIQHLSPDYKSLMDELLARHTSIPIQVAGDGMPIRPNNIYLIPPRKNISIFHEKLYLDDQGAKKGLNLPIDIFFRSLATDKAKHAIGIILSGTGSDGTLGTRAIKEAGGMIMVQDEMTAKFDGMPRSSIATGLVDYILHPSKMPEALLNYVEHPFIRKSQTRENILGKDLDTLTKITLILRDYCGIDFSYYKENTIIRRLERRVSINRFNTLEEYLVFLSESDKEKDILYREMLIGVTRFFRDAEAFGSLTKNVLAKIDYNPKVGVRVWSVGCSTGEEVYTLAMLFMEYMSSNKIDCDIKIFATDIDRQSLDVAGQGFYPDSIVSDIDSALLAKYFIRKENGYQVNENVRKIVVFATHNLLKDPPFSKLDLIVCRNLFIYFKPEMQQRILAMFYYALKPSGYLFMGSSESIGEMSEAFEPVDSKWKLYQGREGYKSPIVRDMPLPRTHSHDAETQFVLRSPIRPAPKIDRLLNTTLASFMPPSFIVDESDNIIHVVNDINPFIELQSGKFSQNLLSILKSDLSLFVNNLLRKLKKDKKDVTFENISGVKGFDNKLVKIEGRAINAENANYYIISFLVDEKKATKRGKKRTTVDVEVEVGNRVVELEKELQTSRENLQATVEELETSNEELQSSNEELIASNEELQSTNEELQSVNEELFTVNSEYQTKIEELTRMTNDLDNLLKNTEVGALYLDRKLCIRKITPAVTQITNILPTDIGRPISHISFMHNYKELVDDVNSVVESLQSIDKEITGTDGKVWQARVRPYRTDYNAVEGIMITFVDITRLKDYEKSLKQNEQKYRQIIENTEAVAWEYEIETDKWTYVAPQVEKMMGYKPSDWTDLKFWEGNVHPDDREWASLYCAECTQRGEDHTFEYRFRKRDGNYLWIRDVVSIEMKDGKPHRLRGLMFDITEKKEAEQKLTLSDDIFNYSIDMLAISGFDGYYKTLNPAWEKTLGWSADELMAKPWIEFVHPDDHKKTLSIKTELVNGQEIFQFENRYICKNGKVKWLSWRSFPYSENRVIFAVARDVTLLKQTQRELEHSRELLQKTLDNSPLAKTLLDVEGQIIYANKPAEKVFGITKKDVEQRTYGAASWKITGLDGKPIEPDKLPFAVIKRTKKNIKDFRHYIEVPGKSKVLLSIFGSPVLTPDGQFDGAVFSIGVVEK